MAIYRELLTIDNLKELYALFDDISPKDLPEKVGKISSYLRDGYKYAANVSDERVKKMDVTVHTDLIHMMHKLFCEMLKTNDDPVFFAMQNYDGTLLNLEAFFDFLDALDSLEDAVDHLEELDRVLLNYVNESNVWTYKECSKTVASIHFLMKRILTFTQNKLD